MLSTMTVGGVKDRTDRNLVVPWLKFLWETYRSILELLHKNIKLERVYFKTCERAFQFCLDYQRPGEFRRLCDILRQQFINIQKLKQNSTTFNSGKYNSSNGQELSLESIELQLQIRFIQLEFSTALEQWNEGFRTVEDIYSILQLNKKLFKPKLMSIYYEKLVRIFWSSENYLFHAYAWSRFYQLYGEYKKDIKIEEKNLYASSVLLSALCIPYISSIITSSSSSSNSSSSNNNTNTGNIPLLYDDEEILFEKNQRMALLLDFQSNPTREALLNEIILRGILEDTYPELKQLYNILETQFCPLTMITQIQPLLSMIKSHPSLSQYSLLLQKVIIIKCVSQLSTIYTTFKISSLNNLMNSLDYNSIDIEKILIDSLNKSKQLNITIDHSLGCYYFGLKVDTASIIETKVLSIGNKLTNINNKIESLNLQVNNSNDIETITTATTTTTPTNNYFDLINKSIELDSNQSINWIIERKSIIERRKEGFERLKLEKIEKEEKKRLEEDELRKLEEAKRLKAEEESRNREKLKKLNEMKSVQRYKKELENLGKPVPESVLKDMTEDQRRELLLQTKLNIRKEKEEEVKKLNEVFKTFDYRVRAVRIESKNKVIDISNQKNEEYKRIYDEKVEKNIEAEKIKHQHALEIKQSLLRVRSYKIQYENENIKQQEQEYNENLAYLKQKTLKEYYKNKISRARFLYEEEIERIQIEKELEIERMNEEKRILAQHEEMRKKREEEIIARELEEKKKKEEQEQKELLAASTSLSSSSSSQKQSKYDNNDNNNDNEEDDGGGAWRKVTGKSSSVPVSAPTTSAASSSSSGTPSNVSRNNSDSWARAPRDETYDNRDRDRDRRGGNMKDDSWGRNDGPDRRNRDYNDRRDNRGYDRNDRDRNNRGPPSDNVEESNWR